MYFCVALSIRHMFDQTTGTCVGYSSNMLGISFFVQAIYRLGLGLGCETSPDVTDALDSFEKWWICA